VAVQTAEGTTNQTGTSTTTDSANGLDPTPETSAADAVADPGREVAAGVGAGAGAEIGRRIPVAPRRPGRNETGWDRPPDGEARETDITMLVRRVVKVA